MDIQRIAEAKTYTGWLPGRIYPPFYGQGGRAGPYHESARHGETLYTQLT